MSGHSKWAQIKRQKGAADARRGNLFTKLGREITIVARQGGTNPEANFRLRLAMQKARDNNMPLENIERAIKRAAGATEAASLEEVIYEGYGPHGVAVLVEALTDNRNRAVADIRSVFSRAGGSLGETGCVSWLFEPRGFITVAAPRQDAEELALVAIDAGAEDVRLESDVVEVYTKPEDLEGVRRSLEDRGVRVLAAEVAMFATSTVPLDEKASLQILKLMERLEELEDVQRVFTNADFAEDAIRSYQSAAA